MFARAWVRAACLVPLVLTFASTQTAAAAPTGVAAAMQAAATARGVPLPVVEAVAYVNTRWEWIATPSISGGVGPMDVTPSQMPLAMSLSGHSAADIAGNVHDNIDAGAALLAHHHTSGTDLGSWLAPVAATQGAYVEQEVVTVLAAGASRTTSARESITLAPQPVPAGGLRTPTAATATDYPGATWVAADPSNYSVADRAHDYPIDMIVIHDIEGSYGSAIQMFQTPNFGASAHYVVSYGGLVTQMVREKDIAWHAGNWDYNTRAIGIEHEGFAWTPGLYTTAEYNASAQIAASICSRWGVPLDRTHVIGHNEVPDPNNPGLFGGSDHHTDPGPYWNWTYYMAQAQAYAANLPSPPHVMPDPVAVNGVDSATVTWQPARTCRPAAAPITGYTVVAQPGGAAVDLPPTATSYTFSNLTPQTTYTFTVTAHNSYGDDTATSNPATPGRCRSLGITANPASPQLSTTQVQFGATTLGCPNPQYQFWLQSPGSATWTLVQPYSATSTYTWSTAGLAPGLYSIGVWAKDAASSGNRGNSLGTWDDNNTLADTLTSLPCKAVSYSITPAGAVAIGSSATVTASATGCPHPQFEFWLQAPGQPYRIVQPYSGNASYSWSTNGLVAGTYYFSVWARDTSSIGTASNAGGRWDAYRNGPVTAVSPVCGAVSLSASPAGATWVGKPVTTTARTAGCPNPQYAFWLQAPGSASWRLVQPYSTTPTFPWTTNGYAPGAYRLAVWVRDVYGTGTYGNSLGRWDSQTVISYTLKPAVCTSVSLAASPSTASFAAGPTVTITAAAGGCPNAQPVYQFWILKPGATSWAVLQPYSTANTCQWSTAALPAGTYRLAVWARDAQSAGAYSISLGTFDVSNSGLSFTIS